MLTQTLVLLSHGGTTNAKDSSCPYPLTQMSHFFSHSFPDRPAPPRTLPCLSQPQRPSSDLWSHPTLSQRRILERAGLVGKKELEDRIVSTWGISVGWYFLSPT